MYTVQCVHSPPPAPELQVRMLHAVHSSTSLGLSWDTPSLSPPLPSYNYTITVPSRGPLLTDQLSLNLTGQLCATSCVQWRTLFHTQFVSLQAFLQTLITQYP